MGRLMLAGAMILGLSAPLAARPALRDVPVIDDGLYAVGLADTVRKACPEISARFFRALGFLQDLRAEAESRGYTRAEVEAHLNSDAEKNRLRARAAQQMNELGFAQDTAGYCAMGRHEIASGSAAGRLLREVGQ
ncbi:DUF5333 domain-containing protein [uncultured Roseobacter sp.]|uniref:DUF5333 domain-containing protein n=1 Tax=uncultured Roseobacter sp. TaxID=114847 RepID=UPI0026294FA5|nr:DUF5333 domain-containing protein [uncultured Roseobacter sp.]